MQATNKPSECTQKKLDMYVFDNSLCLLDLSVARASSSSATSILLMHPKRNGRAMDACLGAQILM